LETLRRIWQRGLPPGRPHSKKGSENQREARLGNLGSFNEDIRAQTNDEEKILNGKGKGSRRKKSMALLKTLSIQKGSNTNPRPRKSLDGKGPKQPTKKKRKRGSGAATERVQFKSPWEKSRKR